VDAYVFDQKRILSAVRQTDRQVKSGHYVKNEDMKDWLLSSGTEHDRRFQSVPAESNTMTKRCASKIVWSALARTPLREIRLLRIFSS
jgi:hypothetical protein